MPPFPIKETGDGAGASLSPPRCGGRLASIERLYEYAGEQPPPRDDVAGRAIRHLHPEILPQDARRLGNQVVCMIAEYHLRAAPESRQPCLLLPAIKTYVSNISFEGT